MARAAEAQSKLPDSGSVSTLIDSVVEFIKERQKTTVSEVSEALDLERSQVEKLAEILEDSNLIVMKYSLFHPGKTELIIKTPKPQQKAKKEQAPDRLIGELDESVASTEKKFITAEEDILLRLKSVEESLAELEAMEKDAPPEKIDEFIKEGERLERALADFDKKVSVLDSRIEALRKKAAAFRLKSVGLKARGTGLGMLERLFTFVSRKLLRKG